jgi:hypothetical protein
LASKEMQKGGELRSDSIAAEGCPSDELLQDSIAGIRTHAARDGSAPLFSRAGRGKPTASLDW